MITNITQHSALQHLRMRKTEFLFCQKYNQRPAKKNKKNNKGTYKMSKNEITFTVFCNI